MLAASAVRTDPDDPLGGLEVAERPDPDPRPDWVTVRLRAASLNHHDLWSLVPKPAQLSFEEAACLPTAWLTAYRMLFTQAAARPGQTVLVQGAGGGVSTALVAIGRAAGLRMWVTSRDGSKRERAVELGAEQAFESGARLPERVDAVMETVGEPTWDHSLKSLTQGGTLVVTGATGGHRAVTDLRRVFFLQQRIIGSTMGTRDELRRLLRLMAETGLRPVVDSTLPLEDAPTAFRRLA